MPTLPYSKLVPLLGIVAAIVGLILHFVAGIKVEDGDVIGQAVLLYADVFLVVASVLAIIGLILGLMAPRSDAVGVLLAAVAPLMMFGMLTYHVALRETWAPTGLEQLAVLLLFFPFFMVLVSGRMIPMQALLTTVPAPAQRGAFLSVNSAVQALGNGCGAWLGGLMLGTAAGGRITGYNTVGLVAVSLLLPLLWWIGKVGAAEAAPPAAAAGEMSTT